MIRKDCFEIHTIIFINSVVLIFNWPLLDYEISHKIPKDEFYDDELEISSEDDDFEESEEE